MTNTIHNRTGETVPISPQESFRSMQDHLLNHVDWPRLIADFANPPARIDYNHSDWLNSVPVLIDYMLPPERDESNDDLILAASELDYFVDELDNFGYLGNQTRHRRPSQIRHNQQPDIAEYIQDWLANAQSSLYYFRGSRYQDADVLRPQPQLNDLQRLATIGRHASPHNQLPWQIEDAIWKVINYITNNYDEVLEGGRYTAHHNVSVSGAETLGPHGLSAGEFGQMLRIARYSYPPELMRGLQSVELSDARAYIYESGQNLALLGEVLNDGARMRLYTLNMKISSLRQDAGKRKQTTDVFRGSDSSWHAALDRDAFYELLEEVLDHELAHIAHYNAPTEWLRRWESLIKRIRIPLTPYADHAHKARSDEGRAELFAEALQVYRKEPLKLMYMSTEYFQMMDELMRSYDEHSVRAAYNIVTRGKRIGSHEYIQVDRKLTVARQATLNRHLDWVQQHGSPLGRVTLSAANRP